MNRIRKSLFILLNILLLGLAGCNKEINPDKFSASAIQYKPYGLNYLWDADVSANGDVFLLGLAGKEVKLIKTNAEGTLIWKKDIPFDEKQYGENNSVVIEPDGSILLFGTHTIHELLEELKLIRLNGLGEIIKTTTYSIKENLPSFPYPQFSTSYDGLMATDEKGGYYLQLTLFSRFSFQVGFETYIAHVNQNDSVDQCINMGDYISSYVELVDGKSDRLNLLVSAVDTAKVDLVQFDRDAFISGSLVTRSSGRLNIYGPQIVAVTDDEFGYSFQLKYEPSGLFTESVFMTKTALATGQIMGEWFIPLKIKAPSLGLPGFIRSEADQDAVYTSFYGENDAHVIKFSKDGSKNWVKSIDGDLSRERSFKLLPTANELQVFGSSSKNRSNERDLFVLKLDRNGEFVTK